MSNQRRIRHMTSEELKAKLFTHFQKNGSFDNLKSQLRGQLISELIKVAEPAKNDNFPPASDMEKCLLPLQVCNWLVYDHLSRQDYQYSLSVFVMEAQLPFPDKFLTAGDILGLLGLNKNKADSSNISKLYSEKNEMGFLHSLLLAIIKVVFDVPVKISSASRNLDTSETRSAKKEESSTSQEKDKNVSEHLTNSKKQSLEKSFRSNSLEKSLEVSFHEQLESVKEESEREVQKLRQRLLKELEKLHEQEQKMQLEVESSKAELRKEQAKLLKEMELLKEKESLLEKEISNKYEQKMRGIETDVASKLHLKDKELETFKEKFKEKEQELSHLKIELSTEKNCQNILKRDLDDVKHMHKVMQDKYSVVLEENTALLKKFDGMADYAVIKEELSSKSKEVLRLQMEIRDIHHRSETERRKYVETVRSLEDSLSIKEPQLDQTQKELDSLQSTLSKKESLWNRERKKLEQELNEFKESQRNLMHKVEDQEEGIKDLHKTIHTLNYKFTNSSVAYTRNEPPNYKNSLVRERNTLNPKPGPLFIEKSTNYPIAPSGLVDDWSLQFLSDAKNRLGKLKEEEDKIQEKCSYIFSSVPESNRKSEPLMGCFSAIPERNAVASFKPVISKSPFNFDDWYRNKVATKRSPYSLNEVKQLVTQSLLSEKTNYVTPFQTNIGLLEAAHKSTSKVNDWFKSSGDQPIIDLSNEDKCPTNKNAGDFETTPDKVGEKVPVVDPELKERIISVNLPSDKHDKLPTTTIASDNSHAETSQDQPTKNQSVKDVDAQNKTGLNNLVTKIVGDRTIDNSSVSTKTLKPDENSSVTKPAKPSSINLDDVWRRRASNPLVLPLLNRPSESVKPQGLMAFNPFSAPTKTLLPESGNKNVSNHKFATSSYDSITQNSTKNDALEPKTTSKDSGPSSEASKVSQGTSLSHIPDNPVSNKSNYEFAMSSYDSVTQNSPKNDVLEPITTFKDLEPSSEVSKVSQGTSLSHIPDNPVSNISKNSDEQNYSIFTQKSNRISVSDIQTAAEPGQSSSVVNETRNAQEEKATDKSEDSVSELSEIHLSCGSEAEVQKEDSDAW